MDMNRRHIIVFRQNRRHSREFTFRPGESQFSQEVVSPIGVRDPTGSVINEKPAEAGSVSQMGPTGLEPMTSCMKQALFQLSYDPICGALYINRLLPSLPIWPSSGQSRISVAMNALLIGCHH
jgi:hypothetical protein